MIAITGFDKKGIVLKCFKARGFLQKIRITIQVAENSFKELQRLFLVRDATGRVIETPDELIRRVAKTVASAEINEIYRSVWKQNAKCTGHRAKGITIFRYNSKVIQVLKQGMEDNSGACKVSMKRFGKFFWLQEC